MDRRDANSLPPPLFRQPPTTLSDDMLLLDALLALGLWPTYKPDKATNASIAAAQLRMCADALLRAVDGMGASPSLRRTEFVCDQLERVQEAAGLVILHLVNAERDRIIPGEGDDADEDAIDTDTVAEPAAQADAKGGAA